MQRKEVIMNRHTKAAAWGVIAGALIATNAHADGRAAQKLGQMGIINQTFQPKPPKSSPGYSAQPSPNNNSTYNPNTINSTNNANAANAANAGAATNGARGTTGNR
jgi:hypothetical protein